MKRTIINLFAVLSLALVPSLTLSPVALAAATPTCGSGNTAKGEVLQGIGQTGNSCSEAPINHALKRIVSILSILTGVLAVIMIMVGGIRYILSGGEAARVSAAKSTLLYALIGLAVAALTQLLVRFVLFQATKA